MSVNPALETLSEQQKIAMCANFVHRARRHQVRFLEQRNVSVPQVSDCKREVGTFSCHVEDICRKCI